MSTNAKRAIIVSMAVIMLFLCGLFFSQIVKYVVEHRDILSLVASVLVLCFSYLFISHRGTYLWIQRNIILPFRRTHSEWSFLSVFVTEDAGSYQNIKKYLYEMFSSRYKIIRDLETRLELLVDEKTVCSVEIEKIEDEKQFRITFKMGYQTVPSYSYEKHLETNIYLVSEIEKHVAKRVDSNFSVTIRFIEKNPYFGFLLQRLPSESIKDFRINLIVPTNKNTQLSADKEKLTVNATDAISLEKTVLDYLSFSPSISGT